MTHEQQQLVRYAEAMGWTTKGFPLYKVCTADIPRMRVWQTAKSNLRYWDPLTDANDALELAERMDITFRRFWGGNYASFAKGLNVLPPLYDTLPAAICAAVDAALAKD